LKLYIDYENVQREFRRLNQQETLKNFINRNSKIDHWCRYLKESCTFYGTLMRVTDRVWSGLNHYLMFDSLQQYFECPLSTSSNASVAANHVENGIILLLKRANSKTR